MQSKPRLTKHRSKTVPAAGYQKDERNHMIQIPQSPEDLKQQFKDTYRPENRFDAVNGAYKLFNGYALRTPEITDLVDDAVANVLAVAARHEER